MAKYSKDKKVLKSEVNKLKDKIGKADLDKSEIENLELFNGKIDNLNRELSELFQKIFSNCKEEEIDESINEKEEIQDSLDEMLIIIKKAISKINKVKDVNVNKSEATEVKLPILGLPSFNGQIHEWLNFKDLFVASVHNNKSLSPAQKLQYLKLSCKGDALKVIQSIPLEDSKYQIAWDLLVERFSNKRELIYAHIRKILWLSNINSESPSAILNIVDTLNECVSSFEILEQKVSGFGETLLIYLILQKLDSGIKIWWERQLKGNELPNLMQLITFLKDYARSLQSSKGNNSNYKKSNYSKVTTMTASINNVECKCCNSRSHKIFKCPEFLKLAIKDRVQVIKDKNLCFNCLNSEHKLINCPAKKGCFKCNLKSHNTLLHFERKDRNEVHHMPSSSGSYGEEQTNDSAHQSVNAPINSCFGKVNQRFGLLATALLSVKDAYGEEKLLRCVIDVGSTANFVTENAVQMLGLKRNHANLQISCLGTNNTDNTRGVVTLKFSPYFNKQATQSGDFFILKNITSNQPHMLCDASAFSHLGNITLADPKWFEPGQIDILLGVTISLSAIKGEKIFGPPGSPFAVNSDFGWLIAGDSECFSAKNKPNIIVNFAQVQDDYIKKFWEIEEVPTINCQTNEEKFCEEFFEKSHFREPSGRYVVRLPFREQAEELGDSKSIAMKRFLNLEKRFQREPEMHQNYKNFMSEYVEMKHMEKIPVGEIEKPVSETFYLPHHPVIRESSATTPLRVVFDGSAKTKSNISLNDNLIVGPRVQQELFFILLRFRTHKVAINADIEKMFRQINVNSKDTDFQRILWRDDGSDLINEYRLTTVTYGLASSPYLATKVLQRLANDEKHNFPMASKICLRDYYLDDLLTGASSVEEATKLISQLQQLMEKGGFKLRKWSSSDSSVLKSLPSELIQTKDNLSLENKESVKVLGLKWSPTNDNFSISAKIEPSLKEITKRNILSDIARIFDPLGWLSPFVISVKLILQKLWSLQLTWDEPVPRAVQIQWKEIHSQLTCLTSITVPRLVITPCADAYEIHAFSDASMDAYASVVYLRSLSNGSVVSVRLITAKTRVSPLKSITLPKLELCAALISARLVKIVLEALCLKISKIVCWTDSTIVLAWLSAEPNRWQTFVSNRVSEIQQLVPFECWKHVRSMENPADCASRGLLSSELPSHNLWWCGPSWLSDSSFVMQESSDVCEINSDALVEQRKNYTCAIAQVCEELPVFSRVSSFVTLMCIIAWCLRFKGNCKLPKSERVSGALKSAETKRALMCIIKEVQKSAFNSELQCLLSNKSLPRNSKLINLSPFLDDEGVIRVGGRLRNADLTQDQIHPIILPKNHSVTMLIIRYYHLSHLHAGPQLLLCVLRQQYFILGARNAVRKIVRSCVKCVRVSASLSKQIMADLPPSRVKPSRPFTVTGVDYAGPVLCKVRKGRGLKSFKCYISIFVCFSTRAVHIELVSDLSAQAFLASLRRFVARRGKPREIVSDCGKNFVGASRELKDLYKFLRSSQHSEEVSKYLISEQITWHFNPPSAPHFGGIWEASVKSMKFHLKRIVGNSVLTIEELSTLLAQIEACLNSRPLCPLSSDPSDLMALTPGHFLIGAPLTSLPEVNVLDIPESKLDRWQLVQRALQHFWKRWSNEYLSTLQQRPKWRKEEPNLQVDDLVIIKNEGQSPLQWRLGRIIKTHPGSDKKVRVVTLKTSHGEMQRPISKLCKLPCKN